MGCTIETCARQRIDVLRDPCVSHRMVKKAAPRKPETKPNADEGRTLIQVRVPADLLAAIDAEAERLSKAREGEPVSRSEAVRILVRRGLAASQK